MHLRTLFIFIFLLAIAVGGYLLINRRPLVDASNAKTSHDNEATVAADEPPRVLAEGQFHNLARTGAGTAIIYQNPEGQYVLQFSEFETAPGEDLQVCLTIANAATDRASMKSAGGLMVAPLKAMMGDQVYELPQNVNLQAYRTVMIFSRRSGVNYAAAPLEWQEPK